VTECFVDMKVCQDL